MGPFSIFYVTPVPPPYPPMYLIYLCSHFGFGLCVRDRAAGTHAQDYLCSLLAENYASQGNLKR
jgi:hypothetical protein